MGNIILVLITLLTLWSAKPERISPTGKALAEERIIIRAGKQFDLNIPPEIKAQMSGNVFRAEVSLGQIAKGTESDLIIWSYTAGIGTATLWLGTYTTIKLPSGTIATTGSKTLMTQTKNYQVLPIEPDRITIEGESNYRLKVGKSILFPIVDVRDRFGNKIDAPVIWKDKDRILPELTSDKPCRQQIVAQAGSITSSPIDILWLGSPTKINIKIPSQTYYIGDYIDLDGTVIDSNNEPLNEEISWSCDKGKIDGNKIKIIESGILSITAIAEGITEHKNIAINTLPDPPQKIKSKVLNIDIPRQKMTCEFVLGNNKTTEEIYFPEEYIDYLSGDDIAVRQAKQWLILRKDRRARQIEKEWLSQTAVENIKEK